MGLYRFLTDQGAPLIELYLRRRLAEGREDAARFPERLGEASQPRPAGKLLWCHAASVGEAMSVLALIRKLRETQPQWHVLLTTGTVTSARLLEQRLPDGAIHQYVPVDRWPYVTRFLTHWQPDLALWVESELWPNILTALRERDIPAVLLNGRMSKKSFHQWSLAKPWAREILGTFTLGLAQTETERDRFSALGLRNVRCAGNLKFAASPLPVDETALKKLKSQLGLRKSWLIASTHPGEDEIALDAHQKLRRDHPDLLLTIVPRHAARGGKIVELLRQRGLNYARRSAGDSITPETAVYLADTMGEMGLFYRMAAVTCIGGSFTWGGHNPVEPAQLGCAMIFGPRMTNFAEIAAELVNKTAAVQIENATQLAPAVATLLDDPAAATALAIAARQLTERQHHVLDDIMLILSPFLTDTPRASA